MSLIANISREIIANGGEITSIATMPPEYFNEGVSPDQVSIRISYSSESGSGYKVITIPSGSLGQLLADS